MTAIKIDQIRIDGGTQSRVSLNEDTVSEYSEAITAGDKFPPMRVFYDGSWYWLADGFHRYFAYIKASFEEAECAITQGTARDARLYSVGANHNHGLRRTNEDKRKAVQTLLDDPEWGKWQDSDIAKHANVGRNYVRKIREESSASTGAGEPVLRKYIDKHGNVSVMNVANIGSSKKTARRKLTKGETDFLRKIESNRAESHVYVVRDGDKCKIGWSRYISSAFQKIISINTDAEFVCAFYGAGNEARMIHEVLQCQAEGDGWFSVPPCDVIAAIERLGFDYSLYSTKTSQDDSHLHSSASDITKTSQDDSHLHSSASDITKTSQDCNVANDESDNTYQNLEDYDPRDDQLKELAYSIAELNEENEKLKQALAVNQIPEGIEIEDAATIIESQREKIKKLEFELKSTTDAMNRYMVQLNSAKQLIKRQAFQLKKMGAAGN